MKKVLHKSSERGHANHGWLNSFHSFSFSNYHNPERMNFGLLRVLNDDTVAGGMGFGTHGHNNMEIISIPLEGALEHKDSMGTAAVMYPGEIQIMSAGTGIKHSEYNHSKTNPVKFLQIWVFPKRRNITPHYGQKKFDVAGKKNNFVTVVSPTESDQSLWINQDAFFSLGNIDKDTEVPYSTQHAGNGLYVFVIDGKIEVAGEQLGKRDALGISDVSQIVLKALEQASVLIIDVPMN